MGLMTTMKARNAAAKQAKGDTAGAMELYREAVGEGLNDARYLLSYTVLLIRAGEFGEARDLLVKMQKYPMTEDQKKQLFVNYACCVFKMGELQKGIDLLEKQHQKSPSGLIYETLGYLYIEAGDYEKAMAFNQEALEYDDEDPITLDNMGQVYFRLGNDRATAKQYFDRAIKLKASQIDTLYFLSQYDKEEGNRDAAREKLETALEGRFSPLNYVTKERIQEALNAL